MIYLIWAIAAVCIGALGVALYDAIAPMLLRTKNRKRVI